MGFKTVIQVTFMAALPLFALEMLAIWRRHKQQQQRLEDQRAKDDENDAAHYKKSRAKKKRTSTEDLEEDSLDGSESDAQYQAASKTSKVPTRSPDDAKVAGDVNNNTLQDALFFPEDDKKPPCKEYHLNHNCHKRICTESHDTDSSIGRLAKYSQLQFQFF